MAQTFGLLPTCVWLFTALITTNKATNQQFVGQMYFGSLEYVLVSGIKETNTTLQNLTKATTQTFKDNLNGTDGFLAIEIYKIFLKESSVNLNFVVHMNGTLDLNVVQGRIKTKLSSSSTNLSATFIPVGSPVNVRIYNHTPIDLCTLKNFKNRCDPNSTKCKQIKETVKCECRGGFENRTVIEGVGMCHQIKDPKGNYPYLISVDININRSSNINSSNVNSNEFMKALRLQFTAIYSQIFPDDNIWVEILALNDTQTTQRRRRESKWPSISVEHVLHINTPENRSELALAWKTPVDTLRNVTTNQTTDFLYENVMFSDNRSPCNITSMCDASSTTCHDESGKAICTCKPGFVNNTLIIGTDVLNPYYGCSFAEQELVTKTTPTASATTSTMTSPARLMSTITSTTTSPTTLTSTITSTMTPSTSMSFTTSLFLTSSVTSFTTTDRLYTTFGLSMTDNFSSPSSPDMTCKSMKSKLAPFS